MRKLVGINGGCARCGEKNILLFNPNKNGRCESCHRKKSLELYYKNKDKNREVVNKKSLKNYYANIIHYRIVSAKTRASKKELDFNITEQTINDLIIKQNNKCAYSGIEFVNDGSNIRSLSIDKIDPTKGYTEDNIQLVCSIVNMMKSNLQEDEFLEIINKIYDVSIKNIKQDNEK